LRLKTTILASKAPTDLAAFAAQMHAQLKDPKHKKLLPAFHLFASRRVPVGLFLRTLDVALRFGVPRVSIEVRTYPPKEADLLKLVRDLPKGVRQPDGSYRKPPASFTVRLKGLPLGVPLAKPPGKGAQSEPAPIVERVRGAFAGYFKPEHFDIEEEVEEIELEESEEDANDPAPPPQPPDSKKKRKPE
jgi:hypothetical protein